MTVVVLWTYFFTQGWGDRAYTVGGTGVMAVAVILGAIAAGGYLVAAYHYRSAAADPQGSAALYAAESGLADALARWRTAPTEPLPPGAAAPLLSGRLPTGDEYEVGATRLDDGSQDRLAYYLLSATGRARGPRGGRRRLGLLVRRWDAGGLCCGAALTAGGDVAVLGGGAVLGLDTVPAVWQAEPGACAGYDSAPQAGIVSEGGRVALSADATVEGTPPVAEGVPPTSGSPADLDVWARAVAGSADRVYSGGTRLEDVAPVTGADGRCDRSAGGNWGAPTRPGHACFDYFPVLHVRGDLTIASAGAGQGILWVEGDLEVAGAFEFYGLALVGGSLRLTAPGAAVYGAAIVGDGAGLGVTVGAGARVAYSGCGVARALAGSKLQAPHPLAEFSWFEILE
jgi:hypothetical protein